ncbi:MAG: hypothetical protein ABL857_08015, partial [Rickettsiales bacterium]
IAEVAVLSPFYLLYGKETDKSGVYKRFWVDLKIPDTLQCSGPNIETTLTDNIRWTIEDQYDKDGRGLDFYANAEVKGMQFLRNKITELLACCDQSRSPNFCSDCPDDESIKRLLIEKGFTMSNIDSALVNIPSVIKNNTAQRNDRMRPTGLIDGLSEITIWEEGNPWNLNQGLEGELNDYPHSSKKGVVASNEDMCLTDLYEKIKTDYYKTYEVAIIKFVWLKKDTFGNVIDKKLFIKNHFPNPQITGNFPIANNPGDECTSEHPFEYPTYQCTPNDLPTNYNSIPNNTYFISHAFDNNGGVSYYGFHFDWNQIQWDQSDIVTYNNPIAPIQPDNDNTYYDCNDYNDLSHWSNFARRMRLESTQTLVEDFQRWTNNNALVGLKKDLTKIVRHYYYGHGEDLVWDCNSVFSKYVAKQDAVKGFVNFFRGIAHEWMQNHSDFDGFIEHYSTEIEEQLPKNIPGSQGSPIINASAAIAIGGIQGWRVGIVSLGKANNCFIGNYKRCYYVELHLTLQDIFGAGTNPPNASNDGDDRDRGGPWHSQLPFIGDNRIPGLTQMWILQHCRNADCQPVGGTPPCYVPFKHYINFGVKFKLCYNE